MQNVTSEVAPIRVIPCCTASDPPCLILSCFTTLRKKAIMDLIWNWIVIISHRCSANAMQSIAVYCSPLQSIKVYCTMHYELCTCAIHCALCTMHCALCNLLHYALTCCTCQAGSPTEFIWPSLSINTSSKNHCHHNHWSQPNFFNMTTMIILVGLKGGHVRRRYLPK